MIKTPFSAKEVQNGLCTSFRGNDSAAGQTRERIPFLLLLYIIQKTKQKQQQKWAFQEPEKEEQDKEKMHSFH